jgi:chromate transporter
LPSALLMFVFAYLMPHFEHPYGRAALHGLKLLAVAVVAQGVFAMAQRLTPDIRRQLIAIAAAAIVIATGHAALQLPVIVIGAMLGLLLCRDIEPTASARLHLSYGARLSALLLGAFVVLLVAALIIPMNGPWLFRVAAGFYRAGALVFGGGHIVLPLLSESLVDPGWIGGQEFLAGYGAAQAVPGPMFSVAAFLGARIGSVHGAPSPLAAVVGVLAIFLPGLLLVAGALPLWRGIASHAKAMRALAGINAAVVGLLAAALYNPVWVNAIHGPVDIAIAGIGCALLIGTRVSVLIVLYLCVLAAFAQTWFGSGIA